LHSSVLAKGPICEQRPGTGMTIATFGGRPRYFFIIVAEVKFDLLGIEVAMHSLGPLNGRTQCTPEYLLLKQAAAVP
jgi:hypothetical protein